MFHRSYKEVFFLGSVFLTLLATSMAQAVPLLEADSSTFSYQYEMDVDPITLDLDVDANPDWAPHNNDVSFAGGVAILNGGGARFVGTGASIWQTSGLNSATEWTLEIRSLVTNSNPPGSRGYWGISSSTSDGTQDEIVEIRNDTVLSILGAINASPRTDYSLPTDVKAAYTNLRIAKNADGIWVWQDKVLINVDDPGASFNNAAVTDRLFIGSYSGGLTAGVEIDYVRLASGAFAPEGQIIPGPGDFDRDGDVDGSDFVAWQANFPTASGATVAQGDGDGDGDVDGADFVIWQTNFPSMPAPGAAPVPEPSAWILGMLGIGMLAVVAKRSRMRE